MSMGDHRGETPPFVRGYRSARRPALLQNFRQPQDMEPRLRAADTIGCGPFELCNRALRKGQAAIFNLTRDIVGEVRLVERAFGLGPCALTEAVELVSQQLEAA